MHFNQKYNQLISKKSIWSVVNEENQTDWRNIDNDIRMAFPEVKNAVENDVKIINPYILLKK